MSDALFDYYNGELTWIRRAAEEFGKENPQIASYLALGPGRGTDPHVERLIEAFAFLTARIRRKIDDEIPELTDTLLDLLYPHYLRPVPSMTILQFALQPHQADLVDGQTIFPNAEVSIDTPQVRRLRFRVAWPTRAMPMKVEKATMRSFAGSASGADEQTISELRLRLSTLKPEIQLSHLADGPIRFYISSSDSRVSQRLYELILNDAVDVALYAPDGTAPLFRLGPDAVRPVGLDAEECVLPYPPNAHVGFRLLTEYFACPARFLFFEVNGITRQLLSKFKDKVELVFHLRKPPGDLERILNASMFRLGCSPAVNLFTKRAEPINVNGQTFEHQIEPDAHAPTAYEVYSVDSVRGAQAGQASREFVPFYAIHRDPEGVAAPAGFYQLSRRPAPREPGPEDPGTDVFISLCVRTARPASHDDLVLNVELTCLNRNLPKIIELATERTRIALVRNDNAKGEPAGASVQISALLNPTPIRRNTLGQENRWKLISHLAINHLSFAGGEPAAAALRQVLRLYDLVDADSTRSVIDGLTSIESRRVVDRVSLGPAGLCRGIEIAATFDESRYPENGLFLFASVLERFLALNATLNSFVRFVAKTNGGKTELRRWKPRAGQHILV